MGRRASWTGALVGGMCALAHGSVAFGQDTLTVVTEQADTLTMVTLGLDSLHAEERATEDSLCALDVLVD